jgi:anti-sigma regulatory factor (Ser/Thr protein kinase)
MHADLELSVDDRSPRAARSFVGDQLRRWDYDEATVEIVELLTSELVTNVFRHARGPSAITLDTDQTGVRVAVSDLVEDGPVLSRRPHDGEAGHGMVIVDACASRWGVDAHPGGGKTVWFRARAVGGPADLADGAERAAVGDAVEVYSAFNRSWARGFVVDEVLADGCRLRRASDDSLLPGPTSLEDLRPETPSNHPSLG